MEHRFGPYLVGETIGRGNFAKVKVAVHEPTGHRVALKLIDRRTIDSDSKLDVKIRREIGILRLLHHPHIMRLYDVIATRSHMVLVLEYVGGGELFEYLARRGRLEEGHARRLFQQLVSGVAYCHRFNVAHRDLKPENIAFSEDHSSLKIGDFGLSGLMQDGAFFSTSCGTPNYAAPEVVSGRLYSGREADVWSCGVVLFTMLCGRLPFDEDYVQLLFKKIQRASYTVPAHVSPLARDLLQRMLVVNPLERATLQQVAQHPWVAQGFPAYLLRSVIDTPLPGLGALLGGGPFALSLGDSATSSPMGRSGSSPLVAADEGVVGEVARRLRMPIYTVHAIVSTRLIAAQKQSVAFSANPPTETPAASAVSASDQQPQSPPVVEGTSPPLTSPTAETAANDVERNVFVAYSILADRKLFNRLQRHVLDESAAAVAATNGTGGTNAGSLAALGSAGAAQSLGAIIAAQASGTYGSLPASMSLSTSVSATHTRSPAAEMPPVPNNVAGLPEFLDGTVSVAMYNARSSAAVPRFRFARPRTSDSDDSTSATASMGTPTPSGSATDLLQAGGSTTSLPAPGQAARPTIRVSMEPPSPLSTPPVGPTQPPTQLATPPFSPSLQPPPAPAANDAFRCGVMFDCTNAKLVMEHVYVAMEQCGLIWKTAGPFRVIAVSFSPAARLHIGIFRRNSNTSQRHYVVDVWLDERCGFEALDVIHELHAKLLARLKRRMRVDPNTTTGFYSSASSSTSSPPMSANYASMTAPGAPPAFNLRERAGSVTPATNGAGSGGAATTGQTRERAASAI